MKVIIAGCCDAPSARAQKLVREAISKSGWSDQISEVVWGGARGIDEAAFKVADGVWPTKLFKADWNDISHPEAVIRTRRDGSKYNAAAGPIRNREMANYGDALIAVWDGYSDGTRNMIEEATKRGLKVFVLRFPEPLFGD